eukprot:591749-Alexandrium_andersonii.AAC.1
MAPRSVSGCPARRRSSFNSKRRGRTVPRPPWTTTSGCCRSTGTTARTSWSSWIGSRRTKTHR